MSLISRADVILAEMPVEFKGGQSVHNTADDLG